MTTLRRALALAALLSLTAGPVLRAPAWAAIPKTVELTLVAGKTSANSTFNFNGYAKGKMTLTIPIGWTVVVHYQNGSALRHSFDVIPYSGKQPDTPPPPAFKGAATADQVSGIGVGRSETLTFKVDRVGKYEFLCGVLGHAQAGMWDFLIVSDGAKGASITPAAAATLKVR